MRIEFFKRISGIFKSKFKVKQLQIINVKPSESEEVNIGYIAYEKTEDANITARK